MPNKTTPSDAAPTACSPPPNSGQTTPDQIAALDELVAQAQALDMGYCLPNRTPHIPDHADRPLPPPEGEAKAPR